MDKDLWYTLRVAYPVVLAFSALALLPVAGSIASAGATVSLHLGLGTIEFLVEKEWLIRVALVLVCIAGLGWSAFRDYSGLFPARLRMHVFFDTDGLEKAVSRLTGRERALLRLADEWAPRRASYLQDLDKEVGRRFPEYPFAFGEGVVSSGSVEFRVRKMGTAWQSYRIVVADGRLVHSNRSDDRAEGRLESRFILRERGTDTIALTLGDLYWRFTKAFTNDFDQVVQFPVGDPKYIQTLTAICKVRFSPIREIFHTVYCNRDVEGWLVPVAYATYEDL